MADDFDKFEEITPEFYQHDTEDKPEIQLEDELDELSQQMVERIIDKMMEFMKLLVGHELYDYQKPFARRIMESVIIGDGEELTALAARQCLDGDTVVFRRDGSAVRLRNHENAWSTGVKSTKRYKVQGNVEVIATNNHPIMTDRGWVPAGDLDLEDKVAVLSCWSPKNPSPSSASVDNEKLAEYLITDDSPIDLHGLDGEEFVYRPITSIEDAGEREVFDVEYQYKGWFVAQGIQVHNSGKSETVADTVAVLMILLPLLAKMYPDLLGKFKDGFWVGLFAPTETQAETLFGRTITRLSSPRALEILGDPEIDDQLKKESGVTKTMKFKNSGSTVTMMTANPRAKIESKSFHMTVIDECQDSEDFVITKSISPMLAFFAGTMIKTGTPTTFKNNFYKSIQLNKRRQTERGAKQNHFQWDWKDVVKVNPNYKKFIKREMLRVGEESDEFQMSFCCRWLLERGMFVTSSILENLSDKTQEVVKVWHKTPVVVGIDPARKTDSTVVTVVWVDWDRPDEVGYFDHRILNWLEIQGDDWEEQYFQITNFLANYDVLAIGIDANGVGDAVAQRLRLLMGGRCEVIGVTSSTSEQMKRYTHMQALIQRQLLHFPGHAKTRRLRTYKRFFQQMTDAEITYSGPNFKVAAPNETHAHDDYIDSLSLATSLSLDLTMPEVQVSANNMM